MNLKVYKVMFQRPGSETWGREILTVYNVFQVREVIETLYGHIRKWEIEQILELDPPITEE